jgi:hypothetical protein
MNDLKGYVKVDDPKFFENIRVLYKQLKFNYDHSYANLMNLEHDSKKENEVKFEKLSSKLEYILIDLKGHYDLAVSCVTVKKQRSFKFLWWNIDIGNEVEVVIWENLFNCLRQFNPTFWDEYKTQFEGITDIDKFILVIKKSINEDIEKLENTYRRNRNKKNYLPKRFIILEPFINLSGEVYLGIDTYNTINNLLASDLTFLKN